MKKRINGEGAIYKRKQDDMWCASVYIKSNGKEKRKYIYAKTQKEVKEKLNNIIKSSHDNIDVESGKMTLQQWMLKWLETYKKNALKITTYENYLLNYNVHIKNSDIGNIPLNKLTVSNLQNFYTKKLNGSISNSKKLSVRTVRYISTLINSSLEQAVKNDILKKNINRATVLPKKEHKEIEPLALIETQKLLIESKDCKIYPQLVLEIFTGLRKGELLGLSWDDINMTRKELNVNSNLCYIKDNEKSTQEKTFSKLVLLTPKTRSSLRTLPLNDFTIQVLKNHKINQDSLKSKNSDFWQENNMIFTRDDGSYYSPRKLLEEFHNLLKQIGIRKCRFHDLRHTYASLLLNSGESIKTIQSLLGHSLITTSMDIYSHINKETQRNSIQILNDVLID